MANKPDKKNEDIAEKTKQILEDYPETRKDYKLFLWIYLRENIGLVSESVIEDNEMISRAKFMEMPFKALEAYYLVYTELLYKL